MSLTDTGIHTEPALALQTVGAHYHDPVFGSYVTRMLDAKTDGHVQVVPEYSNLQAWNADMTKILCRSTKSGVNHYVFNASNWSIARTLDSGPKAVRWSPVLPNILYYLKADDNVLYKYDVSTGVESTEYTFSDYLDFDAVLNVTDASYQEMDNSGRYIALVGRKSGGNEIFCYDFDTQTYGTPLACPRTVNWVMMSPSGEHVLVLWAGTNASRYYGLESFTRDMVFEGQVTTSNAHGDVTLDSDGVEYWVYEWHDGGPSGDVYTKASIPAGTKTSLLQINSLNNGVFGTHTSARATRLHGQKNQFVILSTDDQKDWRVEGWYSYYGEIIKVYLDSTLATPHIERLCHHRSQVLVYAADSCRTPGDTSYWFQPHATISPDGQQILFGSNWRQICDTANPTDPYILDLSKFDGTPSYEQTPDNFWRKLTTTTPGYTGLPGRAYSGCAWDSQEDVYHHFGGGHYTYCGNQVNYLDLDTLVWSTPYTENIPVVATQAFLSGRVWNGQGVLDGDIPADLPAEEQFDFGPKASSYPRYPSGPRPWSCHSYQQMAFDGSGNALFVDTRRRSWKYTKAAGWTHLVAGSGLSTELTGHGTAVNQADWVCYSSVNNEFFIVLGGGNNLYTLNLSTGSGWTFRNNAAYPTSTYEGTVCYDPVTNRIYKFGGIYYSGNPIATDELWYLDCDDYTWHSLTPLNTGPTARGGHGTAWDSKNGVMLIYGGKYYTGSTENDLDQMWIYNPVSNKWFQVTMPATRPASAASYYDNEFCVQGKLVYDPSRNLFLLVWNGQNGTGTTGQGWTYAVSETWVYRYRTDGIVTGGTPPAAPTNLRIVR